MPLQRGSSPLARGTRPGGVRVPGRCGLIPARAGNTPRRFHRLPVWRAHPRSRGEHGMIAVGGMARLGSSPLARGTHVTDPVTVQCNGLIPARAGNT